MRDTERFRALAVLVSAIVLLALASPLVRWLVTHGGETGLVAPGAISFCNVLFVGNLLAGVTTLLFLGPRRTLRGVMTGRRRLLLLANVLLAIAIPTLVFMALETTTVTNVVLLGRFESIAYAGFAWLIFGTRLPRRRIAGLAIIGGGILAIALVTGMGNLARGDLYVLVAALLQGLAACASRGSVAVMPVRSFVFVRNAGSALVFFVIAVRLYGFEHFSEAFAPGLWVVMTVYGLGVVALGQIAWYASLDRVPAPTVASFSMLAPLVAIAFAIILLGEIPGPAQVVGAAIIAAGLAVGGIGRAGDAPPVGATESSLGGGAPMTKGDEPAPG